MPEVEKKKGFTSIISINQLATWATTPEAQGISAHWKHTINTTTNLLKFFFICLHLKNNGEAWSCSATATTASRGRRCKGSHKSAYDLVNIKKIISDGIRVRRIRTFPFSFHSVAYVLHMIKWKPDCWSRKEKRKDKPITMHFPTLCDRFSSSASACVSDDPVFT